jgi:hypothetical protein
MKFILLALTCAGWFFMYFGIDLYTSGGKIIIRDDNDTLIAQNPAA